MISGRPIAMKHVGSAIYSPELGRLTHLGLVYVYEHAVRTLIGSDIS